jgi:hypothetical protein
MSVPTTYTVPSTATYLTADGTDSRNFYAGDVIPMATAIRFGMPGAGYSTLPFFSAEARAALAAELADPESASRAQVEAAIGATTAPWRTGAIYDANWHTAGGSMSTAALTANILYGMPIYLPIGAACSHIGINITVAGAAGTKARLGLATLNDDLTGTLVLDGGEIAVDATGEVQTAFAPDISGGGWHYLLLTANGTPTIPTHISSAAAVFGRSSYSSTSRLASNYLSRTYAALPTAFSPTNYGTAMFAVGLKAA